MKHRTRADCINSKRPCLNIRCLYHLLMDVHPRTGAITFNVPHEDDLPTVTVYDMPATCALDVADRGEHTLQEVGDMLNITRERIRQIQEKALKRLDDRGLRELIGTRERSALYMLMQDTGLRPKKKEG